VRRELVVEPCANALAIVKRGAMLREDLAQPDRFDVRANEPEVVGELEVLGELVPFASAQEMVLRTPSSPQAGIGLGRGSIDFSCGDCAELATDSYFHVRKAFKGRNDRNSSSSAYRSR
jgi:hypothetical protein